LMPTQKLSGCDKLSHLGHCRSKPPSGWGKSRKFNEHFFECIVAPSFSLEALEILGQKKNLRLIEMGEPNCLENCVQKPLGGALLVQQF
jgi:AICAR transformylase/IMP cyclohydrolase PurH